MVWVAKSGGKSDLYKALRSGEWAFKVSPICLPLCFLILPNLSVLGLAENPISGCFS